MPEPCPLADADFTGLPVVSKETWEAGRLVGVEFVGGALRLQSSRGFVEDRRSPSPGWSEVIALAVDGCNELFVLADGGDLWVYDLDQQRGDRVRCLPNLAEHPSTGAGTSRPAWAGLAVSDLTVFLAEPAEHRVIALSRVNGQIRWVWTEAGAEPGDLAFGSHELFVFDRARRSIVVLAPDGTVSRQFDVGTSSATSRMVIGADTLIYVLDGSSIVPFERRGTPLAPIDVALGSHLAPPPVSLAVDPSGIPYVGQAAPLDSAIDAAHIYRLPAGATVFEPVYGYTGPAVHLVFDHHGNLIVVADRGSLVRLAPLVSSPGPGTFQLTFDSQQARTRWHKLVLDGDRPDETSLRIRYRITDQAPVANEPPPAPADTQWSAPLVNFGDALVEGAGRYLSLYGELATTNPGTTPALRAITAMFPRRSYLRYLPAIYQDPSAGSAFLETFLAMFETLTRRLDLEIDDLARLIDPAAAPAEFLPWLASWVALGLEERWSETQQREFIAQATLRYKERGTRDGIARAVALTTGRDPVVVESLQLRVIDGAELRAVYERLYGREACHFCVLLPPDPVTAARPANQAGEPVMGALRAVPLDTLTLVRRIVEDQTPAHVRAGVAALGPWFHLDMHTYLEINTQLTEPTVRLAESVLGGGETGLADFEEAGQVERKARIGMDATLS